MNLMPHNHLCVWFGWILSADPRQVPSVQIPWKCYCDWYDEGDPWTLYSKPKSETYPDLEAIVQF